MQLKKYRWLAATLLAGFIGGFFNGLFGTGGGIAFVLLLSALYKRDNPEKTEKKVFATTNAVVLVLSFCSLSLYLILQKLTFKALRDGALYFAAAIPGGFLGAVLLRFFKPRALKKLFSAILLFGGLQILLS